MTFAELMGAIRSSYAEVLAKAVAEHAPALREAALRHADGTLKANGQPPRIDLGSAPDEALDDLLFALADAGIGAVRLSA